MLLQYNGSCLAIKLPVNEGGTPPPTSAGSPDVQNFLIWTNLPVLGPVVINLDEVTYPYAYAWAQSQKKPDGTPLWTVTTGSATAPAPALHTPIIPSAKL